MNGFVGNVARINLTGKSIREESLDPKAARNYAGGRAFGANVLLEELAPAVDPLAREINSYSLMV